MPGLSFSGAACLQLALLLFISLSGNRLKMKFLIWGKSGLVAAIISAAGSAAFITSFKITSIANVSLIYAAAPFVAAILAWLWLRERPSLVILFASLGAFAGVALIVGGSLGGVSLKGDMLALWMTLMMAAVIVIYRRYPNTPGAGPMAASSILLLPVALYFGDPLKADVTEIAIMASFGLIFAIASVTLVLGARYLPSSETALISTLEAPLAIGFAWLLFAQVPVINTAIGGIVILICVCGSQLYLSKNENPQQE